MEYHRVVNEAGKYDRSIDAFKKDLERLYKMGFRPVTLRSYLDNKMDLPPGASPVVFTFDDSDSSQFRLLEDGSLDPTCALGIWDAFTKEHSDFPIKASFYVLPDTGPWGQPDKADKKFEMLKEWGCEVGSHTMTHAYLSRISVEEVKKELAGAIDYVKSKGFDPYCLALPFGLSPKDKSLLTGFTYGGKKYGHTAALLVGANPAPSQDSERFNPMRLPRIQSVEGDYGITFWLDKVAAGDVEPYVAP